MEAVVINSPLPDGMPCPGCGYDVGGQAVWQCPECGWLAGNDDVAAFIACRDCAAPESVRESLLTRVGLWAAGLGAVTGVCLLSLLDGLLATFVWFGVAAASIAIGTPLSRACQRQRARAMEVLWMRQAVWLAAPLPVTVIAVLAAAAVALAYSPGYAATPRDALIAWVLILAIAAGWLVVCLGVAPMIWRGRFMAGARVLGVRDGWALRMYTVAYAVCAFGSAVCWCVWGALMLMGLMQFTPK